MINGNENDNEKTDHINQRSNFSSKVVGNLFAEAEA